MKTNHVWQKIEKELPERVKRLEGENRMLMDMIQSLEKRISELSRSTMLKVEEISDGKES